MIGGEIQNVKMMSAGLFVSRRLFAVIALLSQSSLGYADPVGDRLFFKDLVSEAGSRRAVQAGEDVVLDCEAAGRPSPTIYWDYNGVRLNPVFCIIIIIIIIKIIIL